MKTKTMKTETMLLAGIVMFAGTVAGCVSTSGQATAGAAAATSENAVAVAGTGQPEDADKMRCKRMVITGSRNGKKVCHTESEWAAMDRAADTLMHDIQSEPMPYIDGQSGTGYRGASDMGSVPR